MKAWTGQWRADSGFSDPLPAWDGPATLVMVFGKSDMVDDAPLTEVLSAYPSSVVIGCSAAGQVLRDTVEDDTLTVAVTRFESTRLTLLIRDLDEEPDSYQVGRELAEELAAGDPELQAVLALSDGLRANGTELARGLSDGIRGRALIVGGLAGDGFRLTETWVLVGGRRRIGAISALGLSGARLRIGHGAAGGWSILGPERRVTRSEGNIVYELDGQPVLGLYRKYLGDLMGDTPQSTLLFPLSVRSSSSSQDAVVRTVQAFDEAQQSMIFTGDVRQNSVARLMRANKDELIDGAGDAVEAAGPIPGIPVLALVISCIGRRAVLGPRTEDELETVTSRLPADAQIAGFYSYGEISPIGEQQSGLLNQTLTITTIQELTS